MSGGGKLRRIRKVDWGRSFEMKKDQLRPAEAEAVKRVIRCLQIEEKLPGDEDHDHCRPPCDWIWKRRVPDTWLWITFSANDEVLVVYGLLFPEGDPRGPRYA